MFRSPALRQHVDCGMLLDMSADKPKAPASKEKGAQSEAAEEGRVRLTGYRPAPGEFTGTGVGDVHAFAWEGDGIEAVGEVLHRPTGLVISRLEVSVSESAPAGLTHQMLRRVPLGEILAATRSWRPEIQHAHLHMAGGPSAATLPPGRIPITDDLLRQVAVAYLEEIGPGKDRAVLQRLEERFGRPKGTLRTWLGRARSEGWLGPAVQGRMGAEPGPRLLAEFARMPVIKEVTEDAVVIQAPPTEGSETPGEALERALRDWRRRVGEGESEEGQAPE